MHIYIYIYIYTHTRITDEQEERIYKRSQTADSSQKNAGNDLICMNVTYASVMSHIYARVVSHVKELRDIWTNVTYELYEYHI